MARWFIPAQKLRTDCFVADTFGYRNGQLAVVFECSWMKAGKPSTCATERGNTRRLFFAAKSVSGQKTGSDVPRSRKCLNECHARENRRQRFDPRPPQPT